LIGTIIIRNAGIAHVRKIFVISKLKISMDSRPDLEQTFRSALTTEFGAPTQDPLYNRLTKKIVNSTWGWALVTSVIVFIILYAINPPFVQSKKDTDDLTKPASNLTSISILSVIVGICVFGLCRYR
jgi:hypothetical protein